MKVSIFGKTDVDEVGEFLQNYMRKKDITSMTADKCAILLAENHILGQKLWPQKPKIGFNFRQMLRDGRDGCIEGIKGTYYVKGASQEGGPRTQWRIDRV